MVKVYIAVGSTCPERAVMRDLNFMGYQRIVLKTDQEGSIKALACEEWK